MTILKCDKCQEDMRLLQEHKIVGDQYLCLKCSAPAQSEQAIKDFYDAVGDISIGLLGFYRRQGYRHFLDKFIFAGTTTISEFYKGNFNKIISPFEVPIDVFINKNGDSNLISCDNLLWWVHNGLNGPHYWSNDFSKEHIDAYLASHC